MARARWQALSRIYDEALSMSSTTERAAFLERECGGDEALRAEVESLLRHYETSFLEPADSTRPALSSDLHIAPLDNARFAPGEFFAGRYRIVHLLRRGGMGEVYRADDLRLVAAPSHRSSANR